MKEKAISSFQKLKFLNFLCFDTAERKERSLAAKRKQTSDNTCSQNYDKYSAKESRSIKDRTPSRERMSSKNGTPRERQSSKDRTHKEILMKAGTLQSSNEI